jgi:hypothetical protein
MFAVPLTPFQKTHVVGYPFKVDVYDRFLRIGDNTPVQVILVRNGSPCTDLPGAVPGNFYLQGKWSEVAPIIQEITPTAPGVYNLLIYAMENIYPHSLAPRLEPVTYRSIDVNVVAR